MKKINLSKKQKIAVAIALVVVCGGGTVGYTLVTKNLASKSEVSNSQVELYYVPDEEKVFINGKLVPKQSKDFSVTSEQGELNEIKVADGALVNKDTLLYICKNTQIASEVEDLKSELQTKKKTRNSEEDESIKNSMNLEISSLEEKIKKLNNKVYSYVYAPFNGKVYLNNTSNNNNENGVVMTLQSTDFYIDATVNEYDLFKINVDKEVEVMLYATKEKVAGKITFIGDRPVGEGSQNGSSESLTEYAVKIEVEQQENFRNGLHVQGISKYAESNLRIPLSSVREEDGKSYVYKVENDIAHKTEINVAEKTNEFVVVNGGINQGETLIKNLNLVNIEDGQNIYGNNNNVIPNDASKGEVIFE